MKWKRVLAFAMSAALILSAPFTNASLVYADEAVEQEGGMENAEPEGEASEEAWNGTIDLDGAAPADDAVTEKLWNPSEAASEQQSGVIVSGDALPNDKEAATSAPQTETEKSGSVTFEKMEDDAAASDLLKKEEAGTDSVKEILNENTVDEKDPVRVIIVMEEESIIENNSQASVNSVTRARSQRLERTQDSIISEIENTVLGESLDIRYHYTWLLNGVATEVPYGKIDEIKQVDGVKKVILQPVYSVAENTVTPYTTVDGEMIGRDDAWKGGYTGKGIVISIIDTGIDDDHQNFAALDASQLTEDSATKESVASALNDLNSKKLCPEIDADDVYRNSKIAYGFNYVDVNLRIDHSADNQGDHGTHVAGIAAANDLHNEEAVGVAPEAQLYVMKVFGANGGAYTDDIIAALEDSLKLGADVVNMSLGAPSGFTSDGEDIDEIYGRVSETNTILAVAAGNAASAGQGNMWGTDTNLASNPDNSTVSSPATYVNSTSVASVDNVKIRSFYFEVNGSKIGYNEGANGQNVSMPETLGGTELEYVMVPNFGQAAADFTDANVAGKVAVVSRGITAFSEKIQFAQDAGAVACLVYNNTSGVINMDLTGGESTIPCASITMRDGELLAAALAEKPESKLTFFAEAGYVPNETAYRMSSFSSWGISPNLLLEPEVTAPGGNIYSTLDNGAYGLMSGTSMATPNVAGISALIMQYAKDKYPEMSAAELHTFVNSLLLSTADPLPYDEETGTLFSPRNQGAGLANAYKAVTSKGYLTVDGVDVPKAELMDDPEKTGAYAFDFHVHNIGDANAYYRLDTKVQTEDVLPYEEIGKNFMAMAPKALGAGTKESSADFIFTYDYDGNGKISSSDARSLYLMVKNEKIENTEEAFRYELDGKEGTSLDDVQEYLDALVDKSEIDINDQVLKVAGGKDATVSVNIQLTEDDKNYMNTWFENGIYVEGFTVLEALNEGGVDLSLPYMGFYGDWTKAPIIDSGFYWESDEEIEASQYVNVIFTNYGQKYWYPGVNPYIDDEFDANHVSISPNGDGYGDYFDDIYVSLLRNARTLRFTFANAETGEAYFDQILEHVPKSSYNDNYQQIIPFVYSNYVEAYDFTDADGNVLANNTKLNFSVRADLDYDKHEQNNLSSVWELPVTIDTEAPVVEEAEVYVDETDGRRYLKMTFHDNVAVAAMNFLNKSNTMILAQYPVEKTAAGESCTMSFDITGFGNQFNLVVGDYAFNESSYVIRTEGNDPVVDDTLLYGYRVADANYQDDTLFGWIGIDKESAEATVLDSEYYVDYALNAAEYIGGYIVAVDANNTLLFIKPGYWDERKQITNLGVTIREMAFDPVGKKLYAYNTTDSKLCTIDIASGEVTNIGTEFLPTVIAMTCGDDGTLYGINEMGRLMILDKENGVWGDEIFNTFDATEATPWYAQSMTFDSEENAIYWAAFYSDWTGNTGTLYRYTIADKKFEAVGTIAGNAEVVGLLKIDDRGYQLPEAELSKIAMEYENVSMLEGDTKELHMILTPWYGKEQQFFWSSDKPEVADVTQSGEVTGLSVGTAVITVSNEDKSLKASCEVSVVNPQSKLNGFAVAGNSLQNQWLRFTADNVANAQIVTAPDYRILLAGEYVDGYIYAYSSATELYRIKADTLGTETPVAEKISGSNSGYIMQDMAYDYSTNYMYGIAQDTAMGETSLVRIDTMTGEFVPVGTIADEYGAPACTLAIATDGTIYVITYTGILYTYDVDKMVLEKIGYTGYSGSQYTQSMAYDHNTQELYWAMLSGSGAAGIMYMDTRTGAAIALGNIDGGAQITSLYSVPEKRPELKPVPVESMELTLEGNTLRMMAGARQTVPVRVLPFNAADRTVAWTVADNEVASIENNMLTAMKAGTTTVTGTKEIGGKAVTVTFTLEVLESTGTLYGYVGADLSSGSGQFWGSFQDNDLSVGNGLADAVGYELYAGTWYDGKIYGYGINADSDHYIYQYMVINTDGFTLETAVPGDFPDMLDLAFDYTQGAMYAVGGVRNVTGNTTLYTVDTNTGNVYQIAALPTRIMTLACTAEGILYGVNESGTLYRIDKESGELTTVGETGYGANLYQSMAYDYNTGNLYWAQAYYDAMAWQYSTNLLLVDTADASVLNLGMVGTAGAQISSLYTVPEKEIEVGTPEITKLLLGSESEVMNIGGQIQLSVTAYPLSVTSDKVEYAYQSSNAEVATVDANGLVTAVAAGSADIIVAVGDVTAICKVQVVGDDKVVYAVNTNGWEISPLLKPNTIASSVTLPESAKLSIATAAYCSDGYFYAVGADGYLWKYTEDLKTIQKIGTDTVIKQMDQYGEFIASEDEYTMPKIIDIAGNPFNGKVYVLAQGSKKDDVYGAMMYYYICEVNLETGAAVTVAEVSADIGRPDEFVFAGENEIFIYDGFNSNVFRMSLGDGSLTQVAWTQSVFTSGDSNAMAYSTELNRIFIATADTTLGDGTMAMYIVNPATGTVSRYDSAAYALTLVDLILIEGSTPVKTPETPEPTEEPEATAEPTASPKPSESPAASEEPADPSETPAASEEPADPKETPAASEEPAAPTETPAATEEPADPKETPAASEEPADPSETPAASEEPAAPSETPAASEEPSAPSEPPADPDPSETPVAPQPTETPVVPEPTEGPAEPTDEPEATEEPAEPTETPAEP